MKFTRATVRAVALAALICLCVPVCAQAQKGPTVYTMPYYIGVDITNQVVTVYSTQSNAIVRQMLCSTGANGATPIGTFYMPPPDRKKDRKEWTWLYNFRCFVQYGTRIRGDILFHSIPYNRRSHEYIQQSALKTFGYPTSHGCVRLRWQDAKFISDNCQRGTKVVIYESGKEDQELRDLLLQSSYTAESGMSYDDFLAVPRNEGELGRYSTSTEVTNLQYRLRSLGYFAGVTSGVYLSDTIIAVKQVQAALGLEETGTASKALLDTIYSDDVPTALNVGLQEGANGPVVRSMQENLKVLGLYQGDLDSVFDLDVAEAVKQFQGVYGYDVDGHATPEVQKAIYYEAGRVKALFPDSESRTAELREFTLDFGRVNAHSGLRIREKPTTESEALDRLQENSMVLCVERGKSWSKVQSGSCVGYVLNDKVDYVPKQMTAVVVSQPGSGETYVVGRLPEDYHAGASLPSEAFADYLASDGSLDNYLDLQLYARVNTGDDAVTLNLRDQADSNGEILAALQNGQELKVRKRLARWTLVEYGETTGYLMNQYLSFRAEKRPREEIEAAAAAAEAEAAAEAAQAEASNLKAVVNSSYQNSAPVYNLDSDDADVLGHLKTGTQLDVVESVDGWSKISLQGKTGYMRDEDLMIFDDQEALRS